MMKSKKRQFKAEEAEQRARHGRERRELCREFGVCQRCHNPDRDLESETMCGPCLGRVRTINRAQYYKRKEEGKPCRGQEYRS